MRRLEGKVVFISGTGGGQGSVAARMFAAEGAKVVGCDIDVDGARATADAVTQAGGWMQSFAPIDLSDSADTSRWIEEGVGRAGGIDVLYNNAGAVRFGPIRDVSDEDWSFTLRNEIDVVFNACRAAWGFLVDRGGGSIVNIASGSGLQGNMAAGVSAHAAAKGAVISLSRQLAAEGAVDRIRVNSISPGVIETPVTAALRNKALGGAIPFVPLGRLGTPEDVVFCAVYLASDESSFVTGANFVIDGGVTAVRPAAGR